MKKDLKIIYSKNGEGNVTTKLALPSIWLKNMGLNQYNRDVEVIFENNSIKIFPHNFKLYTAIILNKDKRYEITDRNLSNLIESITKLDIQPDVLIGALVSYQSYTKSEALDTYIGNNDIYNIVSNILEDKSNWITVSQLLNKLEDYRQNCILD